MTTPFRLSCTLVLPALLFLAPQFLSAQAFNESYSAARNPKPEGRIIRFLKDDQRLVIQATAPYDSPYSSEYLACIDAEGQTLWQSFDWPKPSVSRTFSNLMWGANNTLYLISNEDGAQFLLKADGLTGALLWKKALPGSVSVLGMAERTPGELAVMQYVSNCNLVVYDAKDGTLLSSRYIDGVPGLLASDAAGDLYYSRADSVFKLEGANPGHYLWRVSAAIPLNVYDENWTQAYIRPGSGVMTIFGRNSGGYGNYAHLNLQTGQVNATHQNYTEENLRDWTVAGDTLLSCWQHAYVGGGTFRFSLLASRISTGEFLYQQFYFVNQTGTSNPLYGAAGSLSLDTDGAGNVYLTGYGNTANYDPGAWGLVKAQVSDGAKIWDKVLDDTPGGYDGLSTGRVVWCPSNGKLWVAGEMQQNEHFTTPILTEIDPATGDRLNTRLLAGNYQFPSAVLQILPVASGYFTLKQLDNCVAVGRYDAAGNSLWENQICHTQLLTASYLFTGKNGAVFFTATSYYTLPFQGQSFNTDSLHVFRLDPASGAVSGHWGFPNANQLVFPTSGSAKTDTVMFFFHEYDSYKVIRFIGQQQLGAVTLRSNAYDEAPLLAPRHLYVEQDSRVVFLQSVNQYQIVTSTGQQAYNIPPVPVYMNAATALTGSTQIVAGGTRNTGSGWCIFRWEPGSDASVWQNSGTAGTIDRVLATTDGFVYTYGLSSNAVQVKKLNAATGALVWEKEFPPTADFAEIYDMAWDASAGRLQLGGAIRKADGSRRIWMLQVDADGNLIAQTERYGDDAGPENRVLATAVAGGNLLWGGQMIRTGLDRAAFLWRHPGQFYAASGRVWYDRNNNQQADAGESAWPQTVGLTPGNYVTFPNQAGQYHFFLPQNGAFQATVDPVSPYVNIDPAAFSLSGSQSAVSGADIRLWPATLALDATVRVREVVGPRFGFRGRLSVSVFNPGTLPADSVRVTLDCGPDFAFQQFFPVPGTADSILSLDLSGPALSVMLSGLEPLERQDFLADGQLTTFLFPGDTLFCRTEVSTFPATDIQAANNRDSLYWIVSGAYDPNDLTLYPGPQVTTTQLLPDGSLDLTFRVRFENDGNAPTDFVRVETEYDARLRPETFILGPASAPASVRFLGNHRLELAFSGLRLQPASADSLAAQGFVFFRMRSLPGLKTGDLLTQQAAIYFDFNPPVQTDAATVEITSPSSVTDSSRPEEAGFRTWPNPARSGQRVYFTPLAGSATGEVLLTDRQGRVLRRGDFAEGLELRGLSSGMYWVWWNGKWCGLVVE